MKVKVDKKSAEKMLQEYKDFIRIDHETGNLRWGSIPVFLTRARLLYDIYREIEKLVGEAAYSVTYHSLRTYGAEFGKLLRDPTYPSGRGKNRKELFENICADSLAGGWGKITIEEKKGEIFLECETGFPISQCYIEDKEKSKGPVDGFYLGYFEGILSAVDACEYQGEETHCKGKGDGKCCFVFRMYKSHHASK